MAWIRMDATGMGEIPGVVTGRAQPAETRRPGGASAHTQLSTRLPPGCPLAAPGCLFVLALPPTAQYPRPLGLPPVPQAAPPAESAVLAVPPTAQRPGRLAPAGSRLHTVAGSFNSSPISSYTAQYPRPLGLPPVPQAAPDSSRTLPTGAAVLSLTYGCRASSLRTYGCRLFALFLLALLWKNQYMKASQYSSSSGSSGSSGGSSSSCSSSSSSSQ